jgi:hypothetical protein
MWAFMSYSVDSSISTMTTAQAGLKNQGSIPGETKILFSSPLPRLALEPILLPN